MREECPCSHSFGASSFKKKKEKGKTGHHFPNVFHGLLNPINPGGARSLCVANSLRTRQSRRLDVQRAELSPLQRRKSRFHPAGKTLPIHSEDNIAIAQSARRKVHTNAASCAPRGQKGERVSPTPLVYSFWGWIGPRPESMSCRAPCGAIPSARAPPCWTQKLHYGRRAVGG